MEKTARTLWIDFSAICLLVPLLFILNILPYYMTEQSIFQRFAAILFLFFPLFLILEIYFSKKIIFRAIHPKKQKQKFSPFLRLISLGLLCNVIPLFSHSYFFLVQYDDFYKFDFYFMGNFIFALSILFVILVVVTFSKITSGKNDPAAVIFYPRLRSRITGIVVFTILFFILQFTLYISHVAEKKTLQLQTASTISLEKKIINDFDKFFISVESMLIERSLVISTLYSFRDYEVIDNVLQNTFNRFAFIDSVYMAYSPGYGRNGNKHDIQLWKKNEKGKPYPFLFDYNAYDYHDPKDPHMRWYHKAAQNGLRKAYISEAFSSRTTDNETVIAFTVPVKMINNFLGVTGVDIRVENIRSLMDFKTPVSGTYWMLFEKNGKLLASTIPALAGINGSGNKWFDTINDLFTNFSFSERGDVRLPFVFGDENQSKIYRLFHMRSDATGWMMVMAVPSRQFYKTIDRRFSRTFFVVISLVLAAIVISHFLSSRIVNLLGRAVSTLNSHSGQMSSDAEHFSRESIELSRRADKQSEHIKQITEFLDTIYEMTTTNSKITAKADKMMTHVDEQATGTMHQAKQFYKAMEKIAKTSRETAGIVSIIDDFAFQTNLLALNAAVEASRAGEAGAGFVVVSNEIKKLANRSSRAAREIAERIDEAITQIDQGIEFTGKNVDHLGQVVENNTRLKNIIRQIEESSTRQHREVSKIHSVLEQIQQVSRKNTQSSKKSAETGANLNKQAANIRNIAIRLSNLV